MGKKQIILVGIFVWAVIASQGKKDNSVLSQKVSLSDDGKELMEKYCFSCHNTQGTEHMLAPPMQKVKEHYLDDDTNKEDFINAIVDWCKEPSEDKSKMPGARKKFGLMPKQNFDLEEVKIIAAYLYEHDIDFSCSDK